MNQILATSNNQEKKKKSNTPTDLKSIVRFFAIAIIVFGVLLIISGIYSFIRTQKTESNNKVSSNPVVTIEQQGSNIVISIKHEKPIDKIVYSWNDGEETKLQGMGRTQIEEKIIMPHGNNTLNVEITDSNGKKIKQSKQFSLQEGQDIIAPTIEFADDGEGNVKIVAKDDIQMAYIKYSWNGGEETVVESHPDSPKQIQEKIKSMEGFNKLKVVAVDSSGNEDFKEQQVYAGVPKISVIQEGEKLRIKISDDVEITKIAYILNGQGYESGELSQKEIELEQELAVGENIITIIVTNKYNKQAKFEGKCTR